MRRAAGDFSGFEPVEQKNDPFSGDKIVHGLSLEIKLSNWSKSPIYAKLPLEQKFNSGKAERICLRQFYLISMILNQ